MRTWLAHFRSLKGAAVFLGISAVLVAALFVFSMVKSGDYGIDGMAMALTASILAVGILLPQRISNYAWGLYILLLAARAVATGELLGATMQDDPIGFWLSDLFLFACAGAFLRAAYKVRNAPETLFKT